MKILILIGSFLFTSLLTAQQNSIGSYDKIVYDGLSAVIVQKGDKYGGYQKDSEEVLPIIFKKIDHFNLRGDNLVKYEGVWGIYKDESFHELAEPIFISPEITASIKDCQGKNSGQSSAYACEEEILKQKIKESNPKEFNYLTGLLSVTLTIDKLGKVIDHSFIDHTNKNLSKTLKETIQSDFASWVPAKEDGVSVNSKVMLTVRYNP